MTSEDMVAREILAVAKRANPDVLSSSVSTVAGTSGTTTQSPTPSDFEDINNNFVQGKPFFLKWHIDSDGESFSELRLCQAPLQSPVLDPEIAYNTSTSFDNTSQCGKVILSKQDCTVGPAIVPSLTCPDGGDISSNIGLLNITLEESPGDSYYFGLKYSAEDAASGLGDIFFYSDLFQIEEAIESNGGSSTTTTGPASSSAPTSTDYPSMTARPDPSSSTLTSTTSIAVGPSHSGLATGAKAGIAIGAVGGVLLILIAALLLWRRSKMRQVYSNPPARYASQDFAGDRDLHAEKEMNVMSTASSPYEEVQNHMGMAAVPAVTQSQTNERNSWAEGQASGNRNLNRESYHDFDVTIPPQVPTPPPNQAYSPSQERAFPVPTEISRLHEPGMSPDELARLEEEERRLDEAIAEAERRRA